MEPTLRDGDRIIVNKMILGARIFNIFSALDNEDVSISRIPALGNLNRNDILVFNYPYMYNNQDSIRFNINKYYVKRCIGLPGDTLEINNGFYKVRGYYGNLGNRKSQKFISSMQSPSKKGIVEKSFPYDSMFGWTIKDFGPLCIPKKRQIVEMNCSTYTLYRQLISWEQKMKIRLKDGLVFLGDSIISNYCFEKDYYFVSGDNMVNSRDSRYWGLLPEEYIVGKAIYVWYSKDKYTGRIRQERVLKKIE